MGYFQGLTDATFKTGPGGEFLFYPWGILAKGRVLPDQATYERLRKQLTLAYMWFFGGMFLVTLFAGGSPFRLVATASIPIVVFLLWWFLGPFREVLRYPVSAEKLRLTESYRNSSRSHNLAILMILLVTSLLFTGVSAWFALTKSSLLAAGYAVFMGLCSAAIAYMVRTKLKARASAPTP